MGISVVTWTLGISEPKAVVGRAAALGLDGIQYAGDHRDADPADLRAEVEKAGMQLIAIDPINAGPGEPGRASSEAAIEYYRAVIDFAVAAGGVPVTLHGLSLWTTNCASRRSARERLVECCRATVAYAREQGIQTLYEVCNHYEVPLIHTADACHELIDEVGSGNMRMILDSFHMNINERDPITTLRKYARSTAIYHISDSGRGGIDSGHIDFQAQYQALKAAGFTGEVAIEPVLSHLTPSTAPSTDSDHRALDQEIVRSARQWRSFASMER